MSMSELGKLAIGINLSAHNVADASKALLAESNGNGPVPETVRQLRGYLDDLRFFADRLDRMLADDPAATEGGEPGMRVAAE